MHHSLDVGGIIASVTIQTDTSKPRQVIAAPDSEGRQWEWEGGRERCNKRGGERRRKRRRKRERDGERETEGGGQMTTSESEGYNT